MNIMVNGQPLNDARKYTLTTTTFVAQDGGDGYTVFKDSPVITPPERAPQDFEALRSAIVTGKTIAPKVEGRIKRLDTSQPSRTDCK